VLQPGDYDFISNFSTVWAVFLGAILATIGGFAATQLEWYFERQRRERNAALFFGEVLSTMTLLLRMAQETRGRGDPYGSITMRMLRAARREVDIYDRNRESLLDLRDGDLRARIHTQILRVVMPLDGIFDATQEIGFVQNQMKSGLLSDADKADLEGRIATMQDSRNGGFDFAVETAQQMQETVRRLAPLAGQSFENIEAVVRNS
jgi:hypothetical protein